MSKPPVRTITLGIAECHPIPVTVIQGASVLLRRAATRYSEAGYEVQTVRLSTRPIFDDLVSWSPVAIAAYVKELQQMLDDAELNFCSLGTLQVARPDVPLDRIELIADLLIPTSALSATVQIATPEHGLRIEATVPTAHVMQRLARETAEGFRQFSFCHACLCCSWLSLLSIGLS